MKLINYISIIFIFLFYFFGNAQDEKSPSYFSNKLQYNIEQLQINTSKSYQSILEEKNSTISLRQIGDENSANIYNKYANGEHTINQIGNRNNYQFFNYTNKQIINLGIMQTGDHNLLKIMGANSMFQDLKIFQFGGAEMSVINF
ncbi:hypothetical protein SAMN04487762_0777 [Polaribacter sp. Hel1_33_78]|jgi:hypothetical protein|uniref:hypothetical protein n=1 Tax=Polaribacter sp. Hel1_33_78 TaxID=1336804 RepID=UPI00087A990F|nr:hypothetical protein [Polaribacter sp. Hel1_33_78]MBT4414389.1 hypothetical protein [Polaribacter sp.]SDT94303.1 hypothetical protein SAMN04487762_0777 [Polaribacter sp. Hel1_33_78]